MYIKSLPKLVFSFTYLLLFTTLYISCVPLTQTDGSNSVTENKKLIYDNFSYEQNIKTILFYPATNKVQDVIQPAVLPISQITPLILEFDQIYTDFDNYNVKIVHCNADWTRSSINEMEYLYDFNEFPINDYELSFNTRIPFVHYIFQVPKVKISGNYLLKVYRGRNENDLILTQRFMIYENIAGISPEIKISSGVSERRLNQQIVFSVNYGNLEIFNPQEDIKVLIRQNQRWDNALRNLKPTMVREDQNLLEYEHFTVQNEFRGGNEFRFFDTRTLNFPGQNVANVDIKPKRVDAYLFRDRSRGPDVYGQYNDINGQFVVANLETGGGKLEADYVYVHFFLLSPEPLNEEVYISGALTDWKFTPENKMEYDPENKLYYKDLLLKQGFYNYQYLVKGNNPYYFEGSHFETENKYEIFVYNRPVGSRIDRLIGYTTFDYNRRN
jgi:hypothetical protein